MGGATWRRRIGMAAAILAAAAVLALWGGRQREQQRHDVQQRVQAICARVQAGQDARGLLAGSEPLLVETLAERLADRIPPGRPVTVQVSDGDVESAGAAAGRATHVAWIRVDGRPTLGLRLHHPGDPAGIAIIGFWMPPADA